VVVDGGGMTSGLVAIGGRLARADGTPQSGTITAKANEQVVLAGGALTTADPIVGALDARGRITGQAQRALEVTANDASGESPIGSFYTFTLQTVGGFAEFRAVVSITATATDPNATADAAGLSVLTLGDLVAAASMVGQPVTGSGVAPSTTVSGFDPVANTLTLSAPTTGPIQGATVGGVADILDLLAAAL
jgi:hypothetical protein